MPNGFQTEDADANPNAQPSYPKSLFLIQPLHTGYEMNPVGYRAQESVKVPEGLDLDSVLLPTTNEHDAEDEYDEGMLTSEDEVDLGEGGGQGLEELRRVLRASEGKEKGKKRKKGKKDGLEETPEERLAVCFQLPVIMVCEADRYSSAYSGRPHAVQSGKTTHTIWTQRQRMMSTPFLSLSWS
jgi:hypothetical protein